MNLQSNYGTNAFGTIGPDTWNSSRRQGRVNKAMS